MTGADACARFVDIRLIAAFTLIEGRPSASPSPMANTVISSSCNFDWVRILLSQQPMRNGNPTSYSFYLPVRVHKLNELQLVKDMMPNREHS